MLLGAPKSDTEAIEALEDLRGQGASFLAFAWSSYWWFEHFPDFLGYVRSHYPCSLRNSLVTVFDLREERAPRPTRSQAKDGGRKREAG